jgi:hypothetical protein
MSIEDLMDRARACGERFDELVAGGAPLDDIDQALADLRAVSADLARAVGAVL